MFDEKNFNDIVNKNKILLYKYCFIRLDKDYSLTDDVMNEIWETLYKKWETLDRGENLSSYLFRVADICIKRAVHKQKQYYSRNEELSEAKIEQYAESLSYYDRYFEEKEDEEECIAIIKEKLIGDDKILFAERYIKKKTLMEISRDIDLPYSTLRFKLKRIEAIVKKEIKNFFNKK